MQEYNDFVSTSDSLSVSEPKQLAFPPNSVELPLNASERLLINIGHYDAYYDGISDVAVSFVNDKDEVLVESTTLEPVDKDGDGLYSFLIDGSALEDTGTFKAKWTWQAQRKTRTYSRRSSVNYYAYFEAPSFYVLSESEKLLVRAVMNRFSDLYDNTLGQSKFNFYEQFQSAFGIERVSQMLQFALNLINAAMTPATNYVVGSVNGKKFPTQYFSVLELGTYIELLRHAIRSYVEQPAIVGSTDVPYADRRDYMQRWAAVLDETKASYNTLVASMRRNHLNLGGSSILVSGGIYGDISVSAYNVLQRGMMRNAYVPVTSINI